MLHAADVCFFFFFATAPALNCLTPPLRSSRLHRSGRLCRLALRRAGSRTRSCCNQTLISHCFIKAAGAAALRGSSLCLALGLPFHPMLMPLPLLIYELSAASPRRLALQVRGCMEAAWRLRRRVGSLLWSEERKRTKHSQSGRMAEIRGVFLVMLAACSAAAM